MADTKQQLYGQFSSIKPASIDKFIEYFNLCDQLKCECIIGVDCEMIYVEASASDLRPELKLSGTANKTAFNLLYHDPTLHKNKDAARSVVEFMDVNRSIKLEESMEALKQIIKSKNIVKTVAQIVMTDKWGNTIFEEYIGPPEGETIFWTAKQTSGIPTDFYNEDHDYITLQDLQFLLRWLFDNSAIFVGHGLLDADFPSINDAYYKEKYNQIRDTSIYYATIEHSFYQGKTKYKIKRGKLKELVLHYFRIIIQSDNGNGHDPAEDAIASLLLYMQGKDTFDSIKMNIIAESLDNNYTNIHSNKLVMIQQIFKDLQRLRISTDPIIQTLKDRLKSLHISSAASSNAPKNSAKTSEIYAVNSESSTASSNITDSVNCIDFALGNSLVLKNKYLKYKHKYLELKKLL